jgi:hypothetical protein
VIDNLSRNLLAPPQTFPIQLTPMTAVRERGDSRRAVHCPFNLNSGSLLPLSVAAILLPDEQPCLIKALSSVSRQPNRTQAVIADEQIV